MRTVIALFSILACTTAAVGGDVAGQVRLAPRYSKKKVVPAVYDLRGAPLPEDNGPPRAGEMERVAVFLTGLAGPGEAAPPEATTVAMNQRNRRFDPELLIVPVGSTVTFPNSDPVFHNVFSLSRARSFDLGYYPRGQTRTVRFEQEGIVQVYCRLHPNMHAAIVVTSSPWVARPAPDGSFAMNGVPPGDYTLVIWHNSAGMFKRSIQVPPSGTVREVVALPVQEEEAPHH